MADPWFDYKSLLVLVGGAIAAVSAPLLTAVKWLFTARERDHERMLTAAEDQVKECKKERTELYGKLDSQNERHHQQMLQAYQQHHEQMLAATRQYADAINKMLDENKRLLNQHTTTAAQLSEWMSDQTHKVEVLAREITELRDAVDKQAHFVGK